MVEMAEMAQVLLDRQIVEMMEAMEEAPSQELPPWQLEQLEQVTVVVEVQAEQDLCLVQVVTEEFKTQREVREMEAVEGLALMRIIHLEAVVLEPLVKMLPGLIQVLEVLLMAIHKSSQ